MKILELLRICLPDYWIMNYDYSKEWDKALNRLMAKYKFTDITAYRATIGDIEVWVENHPYASFTPRQSGVPTVRPSRLTILRARNKLIEDGLEEVTKGVFNRLQ